MVSLAMNSLNTFDIVIYNNIINGELLRNVNDDIATVVMWYYSAIYS